MPTIIPKPVADTSLEPSDGFIGLQGGGQSSSSSSYSSPESRPVDLRIPTPEEKEEYETTSEAAEPITPLGNHHQHPPIFQESPTNCPTAHNITRGSSPPLPANRPVTPPPRPAEKYTTGSTEQQKPDIRRRATALDRPSIKRGLSGFFKRTTSHLGNGDSAHPNAPPISRVLGLVSPHGSNLELPREHSYLPMRKMPGTDSDDATKSLPPSPTSPMDPCKERPPVSMDHLTPKTSLASGSKEKRSSSGFGLRELLTKHKFTLTPHDPKPNQRRIRATSMGFDNPQEDTQADPRVQLPSRQVWGMAADTGTGLKSRRLSVSLPHTFTVDAVELYSEFCDQSKIVGRRGKTIGKGATANVKLMIRKGGAPTEIYAVKEFRGKSMKEKSEDYERKVKSEYSIAKSTHHPNIVETVRLCTHSGRWNHVMEFCDQGDLFSLVSQKYLSKDDHLIDRLCLFKQLIQGLNYLHEHGIAHRDVKLENILLTRNSKLKITDFGVSEVFAGIHPGLRSSGGQCGKDMGEIRLCPPGMCGSPPYVAPEVIAKTGEYDPRPLDVWGAAIVMLCMTANGILWNEASEGSSPLYDDLLRGWTTWNNKHAVEAAGITEADYPHVAFFDQQIKPPALRRILLTMLNPDPSKRASISTVAKNRWIKNVECCQIDSYDGPKTSIDASRPCPKTMTKVVHHNHLPPSSHLGNKLARLPGSTDT